MKVRCPQCHQTLNAPEEAAGKKIRCPRCRTAFYLGPVEPAPPPSPELPARDATDQPSQFEIEPRAPRLELSQEPEQETVRCPICNGAVPAHADICPRCGFNRRTGETSVKHLQRESALEEEEEKKSFPILALEFIGGLLPGLFRPGLVVMAVLLSLAGFAVLGLALFVIGLGGVLGGMVIGGAGLIVYGQALGLLLYGEWAMLPECLAECDGKRWMLFFVLLFGPFAILYFLLRPHLPTA